MLKCFSDMPELWTQEDGRPRFTPANLQSHLSPMFENLFLAFQKPESGENEYLMKCVMRVITFVGQEVRKAWFLHPAFSFCGALSNSLGPSLRQEQCARSSF